mmetsp:Transcript_53470/g.85444  ORF Transcript_53470/g.85444 Transcript_53470/m.85444 type:complete len:307 (+) Transcript_53470:66-986(+)|eukprot:CAMPEP_0197027338 /NCGR_PEP_ID=MMETSP1384-20130603/7266_1 /TAXON_ID=29189 /ORGANISM="Ammonia sp." /LENGTH=306 /DNA_ID=CAMNT_0042456169 /DNA_START=41 /DNA_END=961 /DNA_ORIENTATION=+
MAAKGKGKQPAQQLVKFTQGKHKFEVIAKQGAVLAYRDGKLNFTDVLMIDQVFTNSTKGDIANPGELQEVFGTEDVVKCCEEIVKRGQLQYTAQERKQFVDEKMNEIVYYINKNYVDPKTKLPHPADRISNCMKECHIRVDPNKETRRQAEDAVTKMRGKLMFAKAVALRAKLTIKHQYVGNAMNIVQQIATVQHEEWTGDGCIFTIELSKADMNALTVALAKPTNGDYDMTFLDEKEQAIGGGAAAKASGSGGGGGGAKQKKKKKERKKQQQQQQNDDNNGNAAQDSSQQDKRKKKKKHKGGGGQ